MQYLVEWAYKRQRELSWVPAQNLEGALDKILDYDQCILGQDA